jgi:hypothetical protein
VGDIIEEVFSLCRVVAKLVAEDAESPWGIAESTSHGVRREFLDEEAAEGLVVFVQGFLRVKEEACLWVRYCISGTDTHAFSILFLFTYVKWAAASPRRFLFPPEIKVFREISGYGRLEHEWAHPIGTSQ